jgi:acetylornithine deacetylase
LLESIWACSDDPTRVRWEKGFIAPPLPAPVPNDAQATQKRYDNNAALAQTLNIPIGPAVSFWTEASLFSEVDYPVLVFGPGAIAQAHTANEWVSLQDLETAYHTFSRIMALPA